MAEANFYTQFIQDHPDAFNERVVLVDGVGEVTVKWALDFNEAMAFAENLADSVIEEGGADYLDHGFDYMVKMLTLVYYAGIEAPDDPNDAYRVLYNTRLYDDVLENINQDQQYELVVSARNIIKYRAGMATSVGAQQLQAMISRVNELANGVDEVAGMISSEEFKNAMQSLQGNVGEAPAVSGAPIAPVKPQESPEHAVLQFPDDKNGTPEAKPKKTPAKRTPRKKKTTESE